MNLRNLSLLTALAFFMAIGLNSCSPYEEGPAISLRSKSERMANTWRVDYAVEADGDDLTDSYADDTFILDADGNITYTYELVGTEVTSTGIWAFTNDDENVRFDITYEVFGLPINDIQTYEILKLKETEVWIRDIDDDQLELHFVE